MSSTPTLHDIARALVAEPAWRWMPGMRVETLIEPCRIIEAPPRASSLVVAVGRPGGHTVVAIHRDAHMLPDLTDAATLGCVLALCREASRTPTMHALPQSWRGEVRWRVASARLVVGGEHPSEAAALLAALRLCPAPVTTKETP